MKSSRTTIQVLLLCILVGSIIGAGFYYLEWEKPKISLDKSFTTIGKFKDITITMQDNRSGIRNFKVTIVQNKHEFEVASEQIPVKGTFEKTVAVKIVPKDLRIKDGEAVFIVRAVDFSPLRNTTEQQTKITIDSIPPRITLLSSAHNINPGGTCLSLYRVTKAVQTSGVKCGDKFFPGYLVQGQGKPYYVCYFAIPRDVSRTTTMAVTAQDKGGNQAIAGIPFYIRSVRPFRSDTVTVSDAFIQQKAVEFQEQDSSLAGKSPEEVFAYVNTSIRAENDKKTQAICAKTSAKQFWQGTFLRSEKFRPQGAFR